MKKFLTAILLMAVGFSIQAMPYWAELEILQAGPQPFGRNGYLVMQVFRQQIPDGYYMIDLNKINPFRKQAFETTLNGFRTLEFEDGDTVAVMYNEDGQIYYMYYVYHIQRQRDWLDIYATNRFKTFFESGQ